MQLLEDAERKEKYATKMTSLKEDLQSLLGTDKNKPHPEMGFIQFIALCNRIASCNRIQNLLSSLLRDLFSYTLDFDFNTTVWSQTFDQSSALFDIVTFVASNRIFFTAAFCTDAAGWDAFSDG